MLGYDDESILLYGEMGEVNGVGHWGDARADSWCGGGGSPAIAGGLLAAMVARGKPPGGARSTSENRTGGLTTHRRGIPEPTERSARGVARIPSIDYSPTSLIDEQGSLRMYANILLSTDGSDVAKKGVQHGIALAKALNAKVTVITVTDPLPVMDRMLERAKEVTRSYGSGFSSGWTPSQEEVDRFDAAYKESADKVLDEARAMAEQIGISAELLHVSNAHPATAIIETAKSRGCDLIVMSSHGHRGFRKLLLGSQTSEVLADGSVPVLVVR